MNLVLKITVGNIDFDYGSLRLKNVGYRSMMVDWGLGMTELYDCSGKIKMTLGALNRRGSRLPLF